MKKNKIFTTTLSLLFLGIFCKMKTVEAYNFNIYDSRTNQHYQVYVDELFPTSKLKNQLSKATGLSKNLFLIDSSDLRVKDESIDVESPIYLELPINQVTKDGVLYNIYRNQEVVVAGLADDNLENIVIASKINSKKVTKIGADAFEVHTNIHSVTFEPNSSITDIDNGSFACCKSLANITLPDSLKNIGHGSFACCSSLTNITLPDSIASIGNACFIGCKSLTTITLPNSLTSIGQRAFVDCTSLQQINLGNDSQLKELDQGVFTDAITVTQVDKQKFQKFRHQLDAIHQFQNAEKKRSDRLASMINLTDQKYQSELRNIYSLFNRHCSTEDLIFAYEVLTRKIGYSLGEDHPDFIKMKQGRKYYADSLSRIERERALDMMKIESYK